MLTSTPLAFLVCLLISFSHASPTVYPNALALIEAQSDITIIATLIRRDPELVEFFQSVKDVTFFAALDSTFPVRDLNVPPFTNKTFVNAILKQLTLEGIHPTSDFISRPQYLNSKLTDSAFVNLSRGSAVGRLVKLNGKNNFRAAGGTSGNVIDSGAVRYTHILLPSYLPEPLVFDIVQYVRLLTI